MKAKLIYFSTKLIKLIDKRYHVKDKLIRLLLQLLGGREEWSVQCTDGEGSFRSWADGIPDRESAMMEMDYHIESESLIEGQDSSKWRIECRTSFYSYEGE